jgi:hypothetical protein
MLNVFFYRELGFGNRTRQAIKFLGNALGRALPLSVFFNGKKVGSVKTGESKAIALPDIDGILQVGITKADEGLELPHSSGNQDISGCSVSSPGYRIRASDAGKRLEAGTNMWSFSMSSASATSLFQTQSVLHPLRARRWLPPKPSGGQLLAVAVDDAVPRGGTCPLSSPNGCNRRLRYGWEPSPAFFSMASSNTPSRPT